jgi:GNAT superfamily N-acetyltransferase
MQQSPVQFSVHPMTLDDIEPATHVRLQSWLETYVNEEAGVTREWVEARNKEQLTPEKMTDRKRRLVAPNAAGWVAKDADGTIIGVINAYCDANDIQRVGSLYVDRRWHGRGVGGALMRRMIEWSDPALPIELGVVTYNGRAKAFYHKWGFEEIPGSGTLFDNMIPEVKMIRKGDKQ